jgi:tetratricopeptide (TPR) repeat protein
VLAMPAAVSAQEVHNHSASGQVGQVHFAVSCRPEVQADFDRAVALLHSFDYAVAEGAFKAVAQADPECAMAWWGAAMTHFHPLWPTPLPAGEQPTAKQQIAEAQRLSDATQQPGRPAEGSGRMSQRERQFIAAAAIIFRDVPDTERSHRGAQYEQAMAAVAAANPGDVEAQMFYALALLANVSPRDKTHAQQKKAADILEPLYAKYPQHPGAAHYLIHAYDNAELAQRGLPMARVYAGIAPAAPHAQHMPSHIFTRLGMWEDSIASNSAARAAAHRAGDTGEELHAMDYLVYAYLQAGRDADAERVVAEMKAMPPLNLAEFKIGYAATAMPVRCLVERGRWREAAAVTAPANAPPQVAAIAVWARGLGITRGESRGDAEQTIAELQQLEERLKSAGNDYWAQQTKILRAEVMAWAAQAQGQAARAAELMRQAADEEDAVEKLPVTPGPVVPAREQLGQLLLAQQRWDDAAREFKLALVNAPGRRGAIRGAADAEKRVQAQGYQ